MRPLWCNVACIDAAATLLASQRVAREHAPKNDGGVRPTGVGEGINA